MQLISKEYKDLQGIQGPGLKTNKISPTFKFLMNHSIKYTNRYSH